jgi:hypothetical protein
MHMELGKIQKATFGHGGYQDVMVTFRLQIGGKGWGSCKEFIGGWGHVSKEELAKPDSNYKWTHEERIKGIGEAAWEVWELMKKAKVDSFDKLEGVPIRAYFESPCGQLVRIEVLEEVL